MSRPEPLPEDVRRLIASDLAQPEPAAATRAEVLRKLEVGLGISIAPAVILANGPVTSAASSKLGLGLGLKASLIAVLSGTVIAGGWLLRSPERRATAALTAPHGTAAVVSTPLEPLPSEVPAIEATTAPETGAAIRSAAPVSVPSLSADNFAEERRLLAAARSALKQRNLGGASALLAEHSRRFGSGRLGEERERLLVQAAVLSGDRTRANAQAQTFLRRYPRSVYAPGVASLLDTLK